MRITSRLSIVSFVSILFAGAAAQSAPAFKNISQSDVDAIVKELSANTILHSVTPASSMGSLIGFEVGVVGGVTNTPAIDKYVYDASGGSFKAMPHAGLLGLVTTPIALTIEGTFIPSQNYEGAKFDSYALALKWTPTDSIFLLPINLSFRGFTSKMGFSFSQTINNASTGNTNVTSDVKYEGTTSGLQVLVSPKIIPIIEPYAGIGWVTAKGNLNMSGASATFLTSGSQSASSSPTSTQLLAGVDFRLLLLGFGIEYSKAFGADSLTGKLSLKF